MISLGAATGLLHAIAEAGTSADEVLRAAGIPRSAFSSSDGFIASAAFSRVLEQAARSTGDGCFGLHFGERFDPRELGALHYVVVNSPTIADAIGNAVRYIHVHNRSAVLWWDVDGRCGHLRYKLTPAASEPQRQHNEYSMAVCVTAFRMLAGADWKPSEVQFMHTGPDDVSEHGRIFGCGVAFGYSCNALVFEQDMLERGVPTADPKLYPIIKQHIEHVLAEMPASNHMLHAVSKAVAESFGNGPPNLGRISKRLGMSSRTLQRRLNEHGVVFKNLVSDMRCRLALDYLKRGTHTLAEIAFLLGYSEVSAFNRAFKRCSRLTPSQYRAAASRDGARIL